MSYVWGAEAKERVGVNYYRSMKLTMKENILESDKFVVRQDFNV